MTDDDRWRVIEIWRKDASLGLDDYPKEVTVYHAAGMGGSSSPLDSVIARYPSDEGSTSGTPYDDWGEAATGTMDKRSTYFQNWRGDVIVVRRHGTTERVDYSLRMYPDSTMVTIASFSGSGRVSQW